MCPADPLMSFRHRHAGEPVTRRRAVTAGWQTASPHPAPACSSLRTERACCCPPRRAEPPLGSAVTGRAGCGAYRWPQAAGRRNRASAIRFPHLGTRPHRKSRSDPYAADRSGPRRGYTRLCFRQRAGPPTNRSARQRGDGWLECRESPGQSRAHPGPARTHPRNLGQRLPACASSSPEATGGCVSRIRRLAAWLDCRAPATTVGAHPGLPAVRGAQSPLPGRHLETG